MKKIKMRQHFSYKKIIKNIVDGKRCATSLLNSKDAPKKKIPIKKIVKMRQCIIQKMRLTTMMD